MIPPCGVRFVVACSSPSSITPAFSHFISSLTRRLSEQHNGQRDELSREAHTQNPLARSATTKRWRSQPLARSAKYTLKIARSAKQGRNAQEEFPRGTEAAKPRPWSQSEAGPERPAEPLTRAPPSRTHARTS